MDWARVADMAKNNPGLWVPVKMASAASAGAAAHRIRGADEGCPVPLRGPGFDARSRRDTVYVSWEA